MLGGSVLYVSGQLLYLRHADAPPVWRRSGPLCTGERADCGEKSGEALVRLVDGRTIRCDRDVGGGPLLAPVSGFAPVEESRFFSAMPEFPLNDCRQVAQSRPGGEPWLVCRVVPADCRVGGNVNLAREMVLQGWAVAAVPGCLHRAQEAAARAAGRGLWAFSGVPVRADWVDAKKPCHPGRVHFRPRAHLSSLLVEEWNRGSVVSRSRQRMKSLQSVDEELGP